MIYASGVFFLGLVMIIGLSLKSFLAGVHSLSSYHVKYFKRLLEKDYICN